MSTMNGFVNRARELGALGRWWSAGEGIGLVWGRRRVGKTALLERFAIDKPTVFHTGAGRPALDELRILTRAAAAVIRDGIRDLEARPFADWDDALDVLAAAAEAEPVLLVLDEFPELVSVQPELPGILRAFRERAAGRSQLRVLLCGSAVRPMRAMQEERAPLYGRLSISLQVHSFRPAEAALMLPGLAPRDRALVWGIVGGVPLYLQWWDQEADVRSNLERLACMPGGVLLNEGTLVLATEGDLGDIGGQVLRAIAAGRTKHGEIADAVRAEPARTLDRLVELRLVERIVPVTEDARRTRRRIYRIADNFLSFWLARVEKYRAEIERGLGRTILSALVEELNDHMGGVWEAAFRDHLRRLADEGRLAEDVVAIGPWWRDQAGELDAVVLAGRSREAILAGEAKWSSAVDARSIESALRRKTELLPKRADQVRFAVAARDRIDNASADTITVTAAEIFS
jgi:AAA+ ATPase superfamily predicted ATPase